MAGPLFDILNCAGNCPIGPTNSGQLSMWKESILDTALSLASSLGSNILLCVCVFSVFFLWVVTKKNASLRVIGFIFLAAFWSLSIRPVLNAVLRPLESQYKTLDLGTIKKENVHKNKASIVLPI